MDKIEPMISTFEAALKYIELFGYPKLYYFNSVIESVVLTGGSLKHHITISLIIGHTSGKNFGRYYSYEVRRLVINDGGYRTKYWIGEEEYEELLLRIRKFADERHLKLKIIRQFLTDEAIIDGVKKLGFTTFEMIRGKAVYRRDIGERCEGRE